MPEEIKLGSAFKTENSIIFVGPKIVSEVKILCNDT